MAIQDEYQKRLNEAVRAERLASEAAQGAPVASVAPPASVDPERQLPTLNDLQSNVDRIQALSLQKQAALQEQALLAQQRPNQRFLNKDQSFMDAFRNPGAGQRDFALKAGLSLLSSGGTQDLSQRIGHALGAGVQGMQGAREAELARTRSEAQSRFKQFGIQEQAERDLFNLNKEIVEEQRLSQGKSPTPSPVVKLFGEREEARRSGNLELANTITDQIKELTGANAPIDLDRESTKAIVADIKTLKENADKSRNWLASAQRAENALNSGAETGAFAEGVLGLKKLAGFFGVGDFEKDVDASEGLAQVLGENVLELLSSGVLGSGTGLSDNDVKFAKKVTGGTIDLTEETIRYAIDAKRRAANYSRNKFNDEVQGYASTFKDIGKTPAFITQQSNNRYEIVPFKPISRQAQLLYGTEKGTLQDLKSTTGVLSPANAEAIGNPVYKDVSTEDLLLKLMQSTAGQ